MTRVLKTILKWLQTYLPLRVFLIFRIILGCYYKIHPSKIVSALLKTYCGLLVCLVTYIMMSNGIALALINIDYIISFNVIFLMSIWKEPSFFRYCAVVAEAEQGIGYERLPIESGNFYVAMFLVFLNRLQNMCRYSWFMLSSPLPFFSCSLMYLSIDMEHIKTALIFDIMHKRMILLRSLLNKLFNMACHNEIESNELLLDFKKYMTTYKKFMDSTKCLDMELQCQLTAIVLRCVMSAMSTFLFCKKPGSCDGASTEVEDKVYNLILDVVPSILMLAFITTLAESVANEADKIYRLIISFQHNFTDLRVRAALQRGARYVSVRRARVRLLRAARVDSSLLLAVCGFCLTTTFITLQLFWLTK